MLTTLTFLTSILILLSKYLDCHTTTVGIQHAEQELNPIARRLMLRFGIKTTIWAVFGLAVIFTAISLYLLLVYYNTTWAKLLYCVMGLFVAYSQFAVAHSNKTGRLNLFTKFLSKVYKK
jgi:4-hydroxybenzoate polyprenyltransferase